MEFMSVVKDIAIDLANSSATAGTSDVTGTTIDMQDYDGICFIAILNSVVDGSVLQLQVQEGAHSNGDDAALPTGGANAQFTASTSSNKVLVSEVYRPQKRYVTPVLKRGTQNATLGGIIALRIRGRVRPVTQGSTVLASALAADV